MAIVAIKRFVIYNDESFNVLNLEYLHFEEEVIREYMEENPMPSDIHYSPEQLIADLTKGMKSFVLPQNTRITTAEYVAQMIAEFIEEGKAE